MNIVPQPEWLSRARCYYSRIGPDSSDPVTIFAVGENEEASETKPGTPVLRLQPERRFIRVLDSQGHDEGTVHTRVPGVSYVMRRDDIPVWRLSVRSVVRKRHALSFEDGAKWMFDTPFFWWQHLSGRTAAGPHLLGRVGPRKWLWFFWIEPGEDTPALLAAVAVQHRNWWHW